MQYATKGELNILVAAIYLVVFLFLCQLAMASHNIWSFLIKQKKYKTSPLLVFYVIAVLLTICEIYIRIWLLNYYIHRTVVANELMPFLKVNMGLIHCWILIELALRIR